MILSNYRLQKGGGVGGTRRTSERAKAFDKAFAEARANKQPFFEFEGSTYPAIYKEEEGEYNKWQAMQNELAKGPKITDRASSEIPFMNINEPVEPRGAGIDIRPYLMTGNKNEPSQEELARHAQYAQSKGVPEYQYPQHFIGPDTRSYHEQQIADEYHKNINNPELTTGDIAGNAIRYIANPFKLMDDIKYGGGATMEDRDVARRISYNPYASEGSKMLDRGLHILPDAIEAFANASMIGGFKPSMPSMAAKGVEGVTQAGFGSGVKNIFKGASQGAKKTVSKGSSALKEGFKKPSIVDNAWVRKNRPRYKLFDKATKPWKGPYWQYIGRDNPTTSQKIQAGIRYGTSRILPANALAAFGTGAYNYITAPSSLKQRENARLYQDIDDPIEFYRIGGNDIGLDSLQKYNQKYINIGRDIEKEIEKSHLQKREDGGMIDNRLINVEGGELEVNPDSLMIEQDFEGLPPHPENEVEINPMGNVYAKMNNVIIPKDMREDYLRGDNRTKRDMIDMVVQRQIADNFFKLGGIINYKF